MAQLSALCLCKAIKQEKADTIYSTMKYKYPSKWLRILLLKKLTENSCSVLQKVGAFQLNSDTKAYHLINAASITAKYLY